MKCPKCSHEFEVTKGGLSLPLGSSGLKTEDQKEIETPKKHVRGKAREYSQAFDIAWKAYGRKEQKFEAFGVWLVRSQELGGEPQLLTLILGALKWQTPIWAMEGWKFAPYFERYLKRRKWEDEQPPLPTKQAPSKFEPIEVRKEREREERTARDHEERIFGRGR